MDELKRRVRSLAPITIVSSLPLLVGLGFGVGWFTMTPRIYRTLQTILMLIYGVATCVSAWSLRRSGPVAAETGFGSLYGAVAMAGWTCGGHAGAFAASGKLNPLGMIFIGIVVYGLSGALLGAVGGFLIGAGVWFVGMFQSIGDVGSDPKSAG